MLEIQNPEVHARILEGNFGLEKESLRITRMGEMAHTPHPFMPDSGILTDFCENQTEINTAVHPDLESAIMELRNKTDEIQRFIAGNHELLWPFSNPGLIHNEEDIPVATTAVDEHGKAYRHYLAGRYGKYKMTLCGIHYNFSFGDSLLEAAYRSSGKKIGFGKYKDELYLHLAARCAQYGWILNALLSCSPVFDGSFYEKDLAGKSVFSGLGSLRNSESGYWNFFVPLFDYSSLSSYIQSIETQCASRIIKEPRELYYPIRLKPYGEYSTDNLRKGISHIELRMIDLNPLEYAGISLVDARFIHLFLIWLACMPDDDFRMEEQILAAHNFKIASHYDLKTNRIAAVDDSGDSVYNCLAVLLAKIRSFCEQWLPELCDLVEEQEKKLLCPQKYRYAWVIREKFGSHYLEKGLQLARVYQKQALERQV